MAEGSTLNINAYLQKIMDATTNTASKSYMDKSSSSGQDFANVFENINKTLSSKEDNSTADAEKAQTETSKPVQKEDNSTDINDTKNQTAEKVEDKPQTKDKETPKNSTKAENKEERPEITEQKDESQSTNSSKDKTSDIETEQTETSSIIQAQQTNTNISNEIQQAENITIQNILEAISTNVLVEVAKNTDNNKTEEVPIIQIQNATTSTNLNVSTDQNINNTKTPQISKLNVQPQLQQALSNIKIEPENKTQQSTQVQLPTEAINTDAKTPIIEVSKEVVAVSTNTATNETTAKKDTEALSKIAISQEVIDKTNAKVVSVSSSDSSNSQNLLNKQNAQEQSIKLSILDNEQNTNADSITDTAQTNFAQTLNNIQTTAKQEIQAPKEINKTEILSQIYKKLDSFKEEATTKVNIILKPESLGKISLELINGKDGLTAKMTTENAEVKELLDKSLNSLKDTLASQGINVGSVSVKVEETQKQSNEMFSFNQGQSDSSQKEFSNNSQNSNSGSSSFTDDMENATVSESQSEDENKTDANSRQVDYKV